MATSIKKATKKLEFGDLELSLRLDGRSIFNAEKRLGKSMLSLFMDSQGGNKLPPVNEILIVLQSANQTSGVTDAKIVKAFEKYLDQGHTTMDLFGELMELLELSGFFGKKAKTSSKTDSESVSLENEEPAEDTLL
ncbi:DUF6096 family protein [Ligilactobacillus murinus]|jgi:hypothetical protein|uniref:DUF6096 family protein n=1 Tax=Ligilactobacillus murinus TaxID=1622 RepID=UPI0010946335|nr:DUF6096 family protein [Ligilactobacillus murinus]MCR1895837.1 DUF6096 family protein [Ligilactobacillus murinus]TGY52913.1 hypothetical protein E5341_04615 [Ligilactobacillus murinus]